MKEEKLTAEERKRNINKERKLKEAEKLRLEEMATRVSPLPPALSSACTDVHDSSDEREEAPEVRCSITEPSRGGTDIRRVTG
jgi:hypothetical protein